MDAVTPSESRLRALLDATMAIGSELSLRVAPPTSRDDCGRAHRRPLCRARRDRSDRPGAGALPDVRRRRGDASRRSASFPRGQGDSRRADRRGDAAAPARPARRSAFGRLSAEPPADAHVPRRADHAARGRLRQLLLDREGRRRGLHRRGPGDRRRSSPDRRRSRSRTPGSTRPRASGRSSSSRSTRSATRSRPRPTSDGCSTSSRGVCVSCSTRDSLR